MEVVVVHSPTNHLGKEQVDEADVAKVEEHLVDDVPEGVPEERRV